ncbi:MAG TPA: FAD-linked oxidase C-terminal domain-containing protein [Chondromyces sp.]|nr:FAD-linked oxidase C-terminal domain-containing protein [Chondromyces sp.]
MLKKAMMQIVGKEERVSVNETVLEHHSKGLTYHPAVLPDIVVFPETEQEVRKIIQYADKHQVPIVPFGAGSSLEGHIIPVKGGISMDFTRMNQILEVRPEDFLVKVQPGVTRSQLNQHLKKHGLFFPIDPGADATIGGMTATNASGTNAVYYGTMKHNVLGLKAVMANGEMISTGGETVKSSAGYNLTELLVGSEGTLGVFTEITLKLYGIPETLIAAKAAFHSIEEAGKAAEMILQAGLKIGKIELVDANTIKAVNEYKGTDYKARPTLFLEFIGSKETVQQEISWAEELLKDAGCIDIEFETDSLKRTQLWEARHSAAIAIISRQPNKLMVSTDVCVPISKLSAALEKTRGYAIEYGIDTAILGHVGDGNFHAAFGVNPGDPDEMKRFKEMNRKIVEYALEQNGTCSGEHGIGLGKKEYLSLQHRTSLDVMKSIKQVFDPKGILNPGKIFD